MLFIFCVLTFTNAFLWIGFAPIVELTERYYNVSSTWVNLLSAIFMFMYIPGSYLSMYLITKYGLRCSITVGAVLNAVGGWIRYASVFVAQRSDTPSPMAYGMLLVGQALPALAQPLFTNVPAKLAGDWFPNSERDVATVVAALFNPLGNAGGQVIPTLLVSCVVASSLSSSSVSPSSSMHDANHTNTTGQVCPTPHDVLGMNTLLLVQATLATASAVWAIGWFRADPPTPPSRSAELRGLERERYELSPPSLRMSATSTIRQHLSALLSDVEFRKLLVGFGLGLAVFNALLTVLAQLIRPLYENTAAGVNQASDDAGMYGGVLIGAGKSWSGWGVGWRWWWGFFLVQRCATHVLFFYVWATCIVAVFMVGRGGGNNPGLVGAAIVGPILDCTHMYRPFLKGGFVMATAGCMFMLLQLSPNNQTMITIGMAAMGLSMMPLLPVGLETAVECTYPIPEEMSATMLMLVGNVVGLGFTYLMQWLISNQTVYDSHVIFTNAGILLVSVVVFSTCVIGTFQGKYKRLEYEQEQEKGNEER